MHKDRAVAQHNGKVKRKDPQDCIDGKGPPPPPPPAPPRPTHPPHPPPPPQPHIPRSYLVQDRPFNPITRMFTLGSAGCAKCLDRVSSTHSKPPLRPALPVPGMSQEGPHKKSGAENARRYVSSKDAHDRHQRHKIISHLEVRYRYKKQELFCRSASMIDILTYRCNR